MSRTYIPQSLRQLVETRAHGKYEYCLIHKDEVIIPHEPDHIIAEQHGGKTSLENLALACLHCNRNKGPNLTSIDPETRQIVAIYNPRNQRWDEHFYLDGALIEAFSSTGRATANLLKLNIPERINIRQALLDMQLYP